MRLRALWPFRRQPPQAAPLLQSGASDTIPARLLELQQRCAEQSQRLLAQAERIRELTVENDRLSQEVARHAPPVLGSHGHVGIVGRGTLHGNHQGICG